MLQFLLLFLMLQDFTYTRYDSLPTIPNVEYTLCGLNIKYGTPIELLIRDPIFERYTYDNKWTVTIDGIMYKMPDQLYVLSDPKESYNTTCNVYYSQDIIEESMFESFTTGFNCKRFNGMFSLSEQVNYFNYQNTLQESYTSDTFRLVTSSICVLDSDSNLDQTFKKIVDNLPDVYNSTTSSIFYDFFNLYGTAFAYRTVYGGYITMQSSFAMQSTYDKTAEDIDIELNTEFLMFTTNSSIEWKTTKIYQELSITYNSTMKLSGGYPGYYSSNDYQNWVKTVPLNPIIIQADIIPIYELIRDKNVRNATSVALENYYIN